jgi:hypothetical protein
VEDGETADLLLEWRRVFLSASDVDMVTAVDGAAETGGLRMACQSAGKP